jgi:Na+/H+ antiporter NhaD/arsenite permease-like protein
MESKDYLTYSLLFIFIVAISTYTLITPAEDERERLIMAIDWEVIVFLFCLFCIVEILNEQQVFHLVALKIVNKFQGRPRLMFYLLSITSTMIATIIEDLSVAIIFIPIVIQACRKMKLDPKPYMYGVTICINLASTLTPFGSAENVIIANHFGLSLHWHLVYLGIYFVIALAITLFLIDKLILTKSLKEYDHRTYSKDESGELGTENILEIEVDKKSYRKNVLGLVIFVIFLVTIPSIVVSGILGLLLFLFINPTETSSGKKEPSLAIYLKKIDAKLIYFFVILFLMVHFMEIAGLIRYIENLIELLTQHGTFQLAVGILLITSLLSGLLDDAPITILFLPIISDIIATNPSVSNPIFIAFTLGINLGGNFLPQGAACDMMTLELARKNKVEGFTYKNFVIVGSFFATVHVLLGIGYMKLFLLLVP